MVTCPKCGSDEVSAEGWTTYPMIVEDGQPMLDERNATMDESRYHCDSCGHITEDINELVVK